MKNLCKNKGARLIAKVCIMVTMFQILSGYNLLFNKPATVNAMYITNSNTTGIEQISGSNGLQNIFMKYDGTVWGSGYNVNGQLGLGNCTSQQPLVQLPITNIVDIECSSLNTYFIKNDRTVWGCGDNGSGQLGIGNTTDQYTPVQISITNIRDIKSSNGHTIFVKNDGTVWGCGDNSYGQLGIGSTTKQSTIVQVPITNVRDVYCIGDSTIFIKYNATVWVCGLNSQGQLGIGSFSNTLSPVQIPINNIKDIDGGLQHTIFLKYDGTVWCCGDNSLKELGVTGVTSSSSLIQIPINSVKDIECTTYSTMFLKDDGTVWGCGDNSDGELGISSTDKKVSLMQIPITNVKQIIQGLRNTYIIKNDDSIWGCGYNSSGSLGISDYQDKCTFVDLTGYWITTDDRATNAVIKTEISKLQSDFDVALKIVDELPSSTTKTDLSNRLIAVQPYTDVAVATKALVAAEKYRDQGYVDEAKVVYGLPISTYRTDLVNRLEVVQNNIYLLKIKSVADVVSEAESNKDKLELRDLDNLWNRVDNLPGLPEKKVLIDRVTALDYAVKLAKATAYVKSAEIYTDQADLWNAQSFLDIMPNTPDKTALLNRIAVVQERITINGVTNLVITAEETKAQVDLDNAKVLVDALPDSTYKTDLLNRLLVIQNIIKLPNLTNTVTNAVTNAETTKKQVDVDNAKALVNALSDSTVKTDLSNRLNVVQTYIRNIIDATNLVVRAEVSKQQLDVIRAISLLETLANSIDKTNLLNRLNIVQDAIDLNNVINIVVKAEMSKQQVDVNRAITSVNALSASTDKTSLLSRLAVVQNSINLTYATNAVVKAETSKKQIDISIATSLVNALPDSKDKTSLSNRLEYLQGEINNPLYLVEATDAVIIAEEIKTQLNVDKATKLVNNLRDPMSKVNLLKRLTIVQGAVNLTNAQAAVSKALASLQQADVDNAKNLAIALPSSTERNALLNKLINIQNIINMASARNVVNKAEGSKQQTDLDEAGKLVSTLPSSTNKTDLLNRLTTLQNVINLNNATNAVLKAEATIIQVDVGVAKDLVAKLPISTSRTDLLNRLTIVQNNINLTIATNAVSKAELTKIQEDVDIAKNLAIVLPTSVEKSKLLNRLVNVQNMINSINAANAVVKAETSKQQVDVDVAMKLVNLIPSSTTKTNLLSRLATVQSIMN